MFKFQAVHVRILLPVISGLGACAAWVIPETKLNSIDGRLSYWQFLLVVVLTALFVSVLIVALRSRDKQKPTAFRIAAIWLGITIVLLPYELICYLIPVGMATDNPFYTCVETSPAFQSFELPYERPPHLLWKGLSRGDLKILNNEDDPYARPIVFQTDHEGFRNGQDLKQADLLFIGDSFTEAGNVMEDETFVSLVARKLKLAARNLGRTAYCPLGEGIILRKYGLKCRPQTVLWQLAESNDLSEEVKFFLYYSGHNFGLSRSRAPSQRDAWTRRSPSKRFFKLLCSPNPWPSAGTFRDANGINHSVWFPGFPGPDESPVGHDGWPIMQRSISTIAGILHEKDIRLLVVLIPTKYRALQDSVELSKSTLDRLQQTQNVRRTRRLGFI